MNLTINYKQKYVLNLLRPNFSKEKPLYLLNILRHIRYYDEFKVKKHANATEWHRAVVVAKQIIVGAYLRDAPLGGRASPLDNTNEAVHLLQKLGTCCRARTLDLLQLSFPLAKGASRRSAPTTIAVPACEGRVSAIRAYYDCCPLLRRVPLGDRHLLRLPFPLAKGASRQSAPTTIAIRIM
jgi:hypothetical protein